MTSGTAVQLHQAAPLVERQHALIEALRLRRGRPITAEALGVAVGPFRSATAVTALAKLLNALNPEP